MQTINPDHYAIRFAAEQDYEKFYAKEIEFRRLMHYPPFGALANVIVRGTKEEEALARSAALGRLLNPAPEGVEDSGTGRGLPRASQERVSLSDAASRRRAANGSPKFWARCAPSRRRRSGIPTSLVIDVDPMTIL